MKTSSFYLSLLLFTNVGNVLGQQFEKILIGSIVEDSSGSRTCIFTDLNGDYYPDVFISNGTSGGENNLIYQNNGDETFTSLVDPSSTDDAPSDGGTCADYNNDGTPDLFVVNWYNQSNLLYENISAGLVQFNEIDTGIVANDLGYSETASWGDYNNDGLVDLYVTNSAGLKRNYLYKNHGNGYFEKILGIEPSTDAFASRNVSWVDIDGDNDVDLFVTNESTQNNNLYRNDGALGFTKILNDPLVMDNFSSHTSSWADVDNDGDFDVFIGNYQSENQLFINDGNGGFSLSTGPWNGVNNCTFSSSFADYDNDGLVDLFVTNGYCSNDIPNNLYRNTGNGTFEEITNEVLATDLGGSYGCAWGDYNNDGTVDLVVANWQNETQPNSLYKNLGNGNNWIKFSLNGVVSNTSAIGAIIRCKAIINGNPVWQTHQITAQSGYCSQNSLVAHFGLGDAQTIDSTIIDWPSGISDTLSSINVNSFLILDEGQPANLGYVGTAELKNSNLDMTIYPNPSNGTTLVIRFDGDLIFNNKVEILGANGVLLGELKPNEIHTDHVTFENFGENYSHGYYFLKVHFQDVVLTKRMVIVD